MMLTSPARVTTSLTLVAFQQGEIHSRTLA
jgi:hypothetical protein